MTFSETIQARKSACNFCGSADYKTILHARDYLHDIDGEFTYVKCLNCDLVYMNPQVIAEDIKQLYPADYRPHSTDFINNKDKINHLKTIIKKIPVFNTFLNEMFSLNNFLLGSLDKNSRVLDVGCGNGEFLINLKKLTGCEVYGIDLSDNVLPNAEERSDLNFFTGTIEEAPFPDAYFDVITGWQFFEHVANPNSVMAKINDLLKPDGYCVLSMPNANGSNFKIFKEKWYHLDCPRHLCIWTPETTTKIFSAHGFKIEKIIYDKTPWGLLGSLQYVASGRNILQKNTTAIRRSPFLMILFAPLTFLFALLKKSDSMVIYAQKRNE